MSAGSYNPLKAVAWAKRWVGPDTEYFASVSGQNIDPKTPPFAPLRPLINFGNGNLFLGSDDCTNFVSQALYHGGWTMVRQPAVPSRQIPAGVLYGRQIPSGRPTAVWYVDEAKAAILAPLRWTSKSCSKSWTVAPDFAHFAVSSGRVKKVSGPIKGFTPTLQRMVKPGDVVQIGSGSSITSMHHTMFAVEGVDAPSGGACLQHTGHCAKVTFDWLQHNVSEQFWVWRPSPTYFV